MKLSEFFRRWREGIKNLSPRKQLESKVIGIYGVIFGICFGGAWLIAAGNWQFIFLFIFIVFLQAIELIAVKQQLRRIKEVEGMFKNEDRSRIEKGNKELYDSS